MNRFRGRIATLEAKVTPSLENLGDSQLIGLLTDDYRAALEAGETTEAQIREEIGPLGWYGHMVLARLGFEVRNRQPHDSRQHFDVS